MKGRAGSPHAPVDGRAGALRGRYGRNTAGSTVRATALPRSRNRVTATVLLLGLTLFQVHAVPARAESGDGGAATSGELSRASWSDAAGSALEDLGFEGVRVARSPGAAVLTYENRVFRYEMEAAGLAAAAGTRGLARGDRLSVIPMNRGVPILEISAFAGDWNDFLSGDMTPEEFRSRVTVGTPRSHRSHDGEWAGHGTSSFKVDVAVRPLAELRLGIADNPFEYGLWLAPEATVSPVRGVLVTAQVVVQLHDEFDPFARSIAPGRTTVSAWGVLPGDVTGVVSAGHFPGNRYGVAWEAGRFLAGGLLEARLAGDYSGFLKFSSGNRVLYSPMKAWSGLGSVIARTPGRDLELNVTAGQFIHGDRGARVDLLRRFGETDFGFFVTKTNEGSVGGFRFSVPLPVRRQLNPSRLRPVTVPAFPFEYREDQAPTGRRVRMFETLERVRKGLTPTFFLNNLGDLRGRTGPAGGPGAKPARDDEPGAGEAHGAGSGEQR